MERDAYFSVGGHRATGKDILEDVALAHNIKRGGHIIRFRYAPEALSTRMYATTSEMIEGWTKNLALLFPKPVALALWRILDLLLFFGLPVLALGLYWLQPWQRSVIFLLWIRTLWRFYSRVARSNFPWFDVAISIFGDPSFCLPPDSQRHSSPHQEECCVEGTHIRYNYLAVRPLYPPFRLSHLTPGTLMIFLTRKAEFSSAHYYWNESWSPEENLRVFGRCANRNGHGHNYTLEVTVAGNVDPTSGFVVDLKELKDILEREVVSVYDHRHLNLEVPEFKVDDADHREHRDCDLATTRQQDSSCEAASGSRLRDARSVRGLLW